MRAGDTFGLGVLALDHGPGIRDVPGSLSDGFSTSGTPGTGLGAIRRLSHTFDVFSGDGGTALLAVLWARPSEPAEDAILVDGISVAMPGETACGDGWAVVQGRQRTLVLVVDGLGHGPEASEAAREAERMFHAQAARPTVDLMASLHEALHPTRGAAAAVAEFDRERRIVRFVGIGNVAGVILANGTMRALASHHGVLGHTVRKIQEFTYPWPAGAITVLHTDGLLSRWSLDGYPGLLRRHPRLAAGVLYRDFRRGRDDTTVVVVREAA